MVQEFIQKYVARKTAETQEIITKQQQYRYAVEIQSVKLGMDWDILSNNAAKLGLVLQNPTFAINETGHHLHGDVKAFPTVGSKFKFLQHQGYTIKGASRNEKARNKKSKELAEKLNVGLKWVRCSVNPFSLEVGRKGSSEQARVLISMHIPAPDPLDANDNVSYKDCDLGV